LDKTAVVILNYNGRELLTKFLPSVIRFSEGASIIVADNHSTDDSVEIIRKEFQNVRLISIPSNLGYCGGYNYALREVDAEYVVLLNSDVEVTPGWLAPLLDLLDKNKDIAAVQPKILSYHDRGRFEYAGAAGGFIDSLGFPFCRGRIFEETESDLGQYNDMRPVFWASGACLMIRTKLFREMGGLDEDFFAHMEEIDLCWKLRRAGFEVYCAPVSVIYHVGGGTLSKSNPKKTYFNFRNGLSLLTKHLDPWDLIWKIPVRILLDWLAALSFLFKGSSKDARAVLVAHLHFFLRLRKDIRKRRSVRKQLGRYRVSQVYPGSIIFAYFMKGIKRFGLLRF
jgi:GT2 family glycosyltransferase